jgi:hypothetical protein
MKNHKHTIVYPGSGPLLWGNSPTSSIFVLEKKNSVTKGLSWEPEMFAKCMGEMFLSSTHLNGRGPFIVGKQPDNYQLLSITNLSMKGFTWPVGPNTR